jgi:uncharacterized protein (TIGR02594 family)
MRVIIFGVLLTCLSGCVMPSLQNVNELPVLRTIFSRNDDSVLNPLNTANEFVGLEQRQNRTELKELMGIDPVHTEWCAAFVNAVLEIEGIPNLYDIESPAPLLAKSFLKWGTPVSPENIQLGDLVIFPRGTQGWQGHVGFYAGTENGEWVILGGNQDQSVSYGYFNPNRSIGIRRYVINTSAQ